MTTPLYATFKRSLRGGIQKGLSGYVWMLKIILPISFLTFLIDASGVLHRIDFLLSPAMGLLGLPSGAAIPLLLGLLTGVYGTLAALSAMTFSVPQMTLIAVFILIAHNLIQEGIVQGKSGLNPFVTTTARLAAAIVMVMALAPLLASGAQAASAVDSGALSAGVPFVHLLKSWSIATLRLCVKIFVIIMTLMVILSALKDFHLAERIAAFMRPLLELLGLSERVGLLWLTACLFGLSYGAAVIVEEARRGNFTSAELVRLHLSIGINHSMVDDPLLFAAFGINPFWLWIPRLIAAVFVVRVYMLFHKLRLQRSGGGRSDVS